MCQDWGGPLGLRVLSEAPQRFAAVLVANTLLPTCEPPPRGIAGWPGEIIRTGWPRLRPQATCRWAASSRPCHAAPTPAALPGYDAPFPDASYKAGVLAFPGLIPIRADMAGCAANRRVWQVLEQFQQPFLTAFSDSDPSTAPWAQVFQRRIPGPPASRTRRSARPGISCRRSRARRSPPCWSICCGACTPRRRAERGSARP